MSIDRHRLGLLFALATSLCFAACGDQKLGPDAGLGICSDGIDNDGDGKTDFPADFGCENESDDTEENTSPQCSDHRDNDEDGKIDFPADPGCVAPNQEDETDDCPNGPLCPQCSDGVDNDFNGQTDWPSDSTGCISAGDTIEFTDNSVACGNGLSITQLPPSGTDMGMLGSSSVTNLMTSCGNVAAGSPAVAYAFHISNPSVIVASTDDAMTSVDTVVTVRSAMCSDADAEVGCADDISSTNNKSTLTKPLQPGNYYLIVSAKTATAMGSYKVTLQVFPGEGVACTDPDDCGPGLVCRVPAGGTSMICTGPVCNDGRDDDADGKVDYPVDPGCTGPTDSDEADVCATTPNSPQCPACGNGVDDDLDGDIDYPNDSTCVSASTTAESCMQSEPIMVATTAQTMGTTAGATNDFRPPPGTFNGHACSTTGTHTAPDKAIQIDIPAMDTISMTLNPVGFDSSQTLLDASCTGTPIECYDSPSLMSMSNLAGGRYYLIVDGWGTSSGTFTLNINGNIKNGESCESALAQSGAIKCNTGFACNGTPGSRTCQPAQCNDGMDNNGDGTMDFPADPGCLTPSDNSEDTVCPGTTCPACSDGVDNDGDTQTDYPADTGCLSAGQNNEGCRETEALLAITAPVTTGTLVGATDDHDPKCVTTNLADRVYTLDVPSTLQSLRIDTIGSAVDTVLSLMNNTCSEPSIACNDDGGGGTASLITRTNVLPGQYTIAVDSDSTTLNTFVLNVQGVIMPGGSCEGALAQAGVFVCPPNFGCNGIPGSRTCSPSQCNDGVDNNGDGKIDFPDDPGCTSDLDNVEDMVCPGSSCPACADGVDNDSDGLTDFPADTACLSASGTIEGCGDPDQAGAILMPQTTGTTVGAANNHQPVCSTNTTGLDVVHTLTVPRLDSLTIDTNNAVLDTVVSLMNSDCAAPDIACDDNSGSGTGDSKITRTNVAAGTYTVMVDSLSATGNTYILNVAGVVTPGESCESPLFSTGVLKCSLGFACKGAMGSRTCALAECIDGQDNNSDGRTDFPADPGCDSFSDDDEAGVCPGPTCPICSDGIDNDMDGQIDYPIDTSCISASANNEACAQSEAVNVITSMVTTGTTVGQSDDFTPSCGSSSHAAPDVALQLNIPEMATLSLNLTGFDTAHSLLNATCGGTAIACSDPALMTRTNVPAGTYYVVVDGWGTGSGAWTLTTTGTIAANGSCEGPLAQSGAFTCGAGFACSGTPGSRTCQLALCNDGLDNDGDGKMDFPADPGCGSVNDNDEADDCFPTVGPECPACANGLDDDMDALTDFPMDTRCASASFFMEDFCMAEADLGGMITVPTVTGTLSGAANNFTSQSCQSSTGNDRSWGLELPVPVASLQIDTIGSVASDTILSFRNGTCMTELGCDDDGDPASNRSLLALTNVAAGKYAVIVDGFSSSNNSGVTVNVRGTVAAGTACTSQLFTTGVLACPTGTTCSMGTCQ